MIKLLPSVFVKQAKRKKEEVRPFFSIWQALYMSFYSPKLYVDVVQRWKGFGLKFLFLASVLISLPYSIYQMNKFNTYYNDELLVALENMPTLNVVKGKVVFNKPMPYVVRSENSSKPLVVIDTKKSLSALGNRLSKASIVIAKDGFYLDGKQNTAPFVQNSPVNSSVYDSKFPTNYTGKIEPTYFLKTVESIKSKLIYFIPTTVAMSAFFCEMVILFVLSFVGSLFANILIRYSLNFKQSLRTAYVCATPQQALALIFSLKGVQNTTSGLTMFGVFLFYFCFAVAANKRAARSLVVA